MEDHKKRGAAPGERSTLGRSFADSERYEPTPNRKFAQLDALDRLGFYRTDLDAWDRSGRVGPMPSPDRFGLRLGSLSSSEVYWRAAK